MTTFLQRIGGKKDWYCVKHGTSAAPPCVPVGAWLSQRMKPVGAKHTRTYADVVLRGFYLSVGCRVTHVARAGVRAQRVVAFGFGAAHSRVVTLINVWGGGNWVWLRTHVLRCTTATATWVQTLANGPETHVGLESCGAFAVEAPHVVGARSVVCADILEAFVNICRQSAIGANPVSRGPVWHDSVMSRFYRHLYFTWEFLFLMT